MVETWGPHEFQDDYLEVCIVHTSIMHELRLRMHAIFKWVNVLWSVSKGALVRINTPMGGPTDIPTPNCNPILLSRNHWPFTDRRIVASKRYPVLSVTQTTFRIFWMMPIHVYVYMYLIPRYLAGFLLVHWPVGLSVGWITLSHHSES